MTERFRKDTLMSMMNTGDILETIEMFTQDNLDVRTVTMGISLLDCIDPDPKKACEKIYNKITTKAADLVPAVEHISAEYGIPIINKRISVTSGSISTLRLRMSTPFAMWRSSTSSRCVSAASSLAFAAASADASIFCIRKNLLQLCLSQKPNRLRKASAEEELLYPR